jgi:O-antigen ligase
MITIGWGIGWLYFNSNEWATANRLIGLIMALSFLFSGAALRFHLSQELLLKLGFVLAFSFIFSAFYKILIFNLHGVNYVTLYNWKSSVQGFMGDRNAFCFLGALCSTYIVYNLRLSDINNKSIKIAATLLSLITILLIYSGSRTGLGAAVFIGIYTILFLNKHILLIMLVSILTVSCLESISTFSTGGYDILVLDGRNFLATLNVDDVRASSWVSGLNLFFENPIFGAGLGANMNQTGIVIHNVWVWILAEMGLVGLLLCLPLAFVFAKIVWKRLYKINIPMSQDSQLHGTVLFIIIFGGFSLFQDIAYQRILWLLLGFILANSFTDKNKIEN